jgi:Protein of unknown function (DUF2846)
MVWRGVALLAVAALLTSCVTERTGFDHAGLIQKVGPPRAGQSRIVVLQEKTNGLAATSCDVKLDNGAIGRLTTGTYVYADRPAGRHQLSATETMFPGESKRDFTTESGRTYFFLARTSERHNALTGMTIAGGLAGMLIASAVTSGSDSPGPVDFFPLADAAARTAIAQLQLAQ